MQLQSLQTAQTSGLGVPISVPYSSLEQGDSLVGALHRIADQYDVALSPIQRGAKTIDTTVWGASSAVWDALDAVAALIGLD